MSAGETSSDEGQHGLLVPDVVHRLLAAEGGTTAVESAVRPAPILILIAVPEEISTQLFKPLTSHVSRLSGEVYDGKKISG